MSKRLINIGIVIVANIILIHFSMPAYYVCSQMSLSSGSERETTMLVIVNRYIGLEKIVQDILEEHDKVNFDVPSNRIELRLYRSRKQLRNGKYFKRFEADNSSHTIIEME